MAGGVWSGIAAGLLLATVGLAAASLMGPPPTGASDSPPLPPLAEGPGGLSPPPDEEQHEGQRSPEPGSGAMEAPDRPAEAPRLPLREGSATASGPDRTLSDPDAPGLPPALPVIETLPQPTGWIDPPLRPAPSAGLPAALLPPALSAPQEEGLPLLSPTSVRPLLPDPAAPAAPAAGEAEGRRLFAGRDAAFLVAPPPPLRDPAEAAPATGLAAQTTEPPLPPDSAAAAAVPPAAEAGDPRALVRHAAAFEDPGDGRPLLSIVLLDDPALGGGVAAVAALPVPVSVALDPASGDAAARMAAYRAAGIEILALAALPPGARPVDPAVVYEGIFATLPEAVAVLDLGEGGLEAGSAAAPAALGRLARDGRGAVLAEEGLGTALRRAAQAGVPAVALRRDLDGEGQDARVIRRFLDDAAWRAAREGPVVLLARLRPETLEALTLWAGGRRAQEVTVAPVSSLLRAAAEETEEPAPGSAAGP